MGRKGTQVILFDGVCNLCASSVLWIVRYDPNQKFKFASLQSEEASRILARYHMDHIDRYDSFLLVDIEGNDHRIYSQSTAALQIVRQLSGFWPLLYIFSLVPPFIRNPIYRLVAKNRYKWFGVKQECMMPTKELMERFNIPHEIFGTAHS